MTRSCLAALLTLSLPVAMTQVAAQQPPAPKAPKAPPATSATKTTGGARTVALTGGDDMKFSVTEITAKPGETIHIQLKNIGTIPKMAMAHNVVVRQADDEGRGIQHRRGMRPRHRFHSGGDEGGGRRVHATRRSRRNRRNRRSKSRRRAGTYPFMCTFPGHFTAGMKGNLVVK